MLERLELVAPRRALPARLLLGRDRRRARLVRSRSAHDGGGVGQRVEAGEGLGLAQRGERDGALLPEDARMLAW